MVRHYTFYSNEEPVLVTDVQWDTNMSRDFSASGIVVPDFCSYLPTDSVTVECWINPYRGAETALFNNGLSTGGSNRILAHVPWSNNQMYWDHGNISGTGRATAPYPTGYASPWRHLAFVADVKNGRMSIYVDGILYLNASNVDQYRPEKDDFYIGCWKATTARYPGRVGEMRIWDYARSPEQTLAQMNLSFETPKPGLLACWRLDSQDGQALDRSGNNRHGILI